MSTNSISSSTAATYATELAESSKLKRSLYSIGKAIENGNLTSANAKLGALMKAFPQYASAGGGSATSSSAINQDFAAISKAIDNQDVDAAKTAWSQLKSDLSKAGVSQLTDGSEATAKLVAENRASIDQSILSSFFGDNSSESMVSTLLAGNASNTNFLQGVMSTWATYQANGSSTPKASQSGSVLNTII